MTLKLFTGGKAGVARLNLFQIHAWAEEIERPPLDGGADPWSDVPEKAIDPASLTVLDKHPGADGNLWLVLPDNSPGIDITVKAPRCHHFDANASAGKYHSYFEVFVDQPWPSYPTNNYHDDPDDPLYNPTPVGYPYVSSAQIGGHAWWKLTTDAPTDIVNQFANINASQWLNTEVGYGADPDLSISDWLIAIENVTSPTGSGVLPFTNTHTWTVHRTYAIGFQSKGLIEGLNHTEHVHEYPGAYDLRYHNCVQEAIITGRASGVGFSINDWIPEFFGFDLPPDNP